VAVQEHALTSDVLKAAIQEGHLLLHCTPVGMHPDVDESCVPAGLLRSHLAVMDIVYNPLETRLLREAGAAGCRTIKGVEMFLNQAVGQFELWTGRPAPVDVMRSVLESRFA